MGCGLSRGDKTFTNCVHAKRNVHFVDSSVKGFYEMASLLFSACLIWLIISSLGEYSRRLLDLAGRRKRSQLFVYAKRSVLLSFELVCVSLSFSLTTTVYPPLLRLSAGQLAEPGWRWHFSSSSLLRFEIRYPSCTERDRDTVSVCST